MQAQKTGPLDLTCKDKFLIQNTIVPAGTVDEDVTSEMVGSSTCSKILSYLSYLLILLL